MRCVEEIQIMKPFFKLLGIAVLSAGFAGISAQSAQAGSPYGTWKRPSTGAHIKVYKCAGGLGMKVVKSKKKSSVGKRLMCGAKKSGKNTWKGTLTSSEDGKKYSGTVKLIGSRLKLTGCAMVVFCKSENWSRL